MEYATAEGLVMAERWLSVDEIAQHLGVSRDTIYGWIGKRAMPAHKVGRLWKFQTEEVDAWVRAGSAGDEVDETNEEGGRQGKSV